MSKIFAQNIDFNKNEALNFRLENQITFPSVTAPDAGFVFFHSANNKFYGWDGAGWTELGLGGAGAADGVVSNVTLSGSNLTFTGSGGGFNGVVDLSSLGSGGTISDAEYGPLWNGDTLIAPSKNAIYDEIENVKSTVIDSYTKIESDNKYLLNSTDTFTGTLTLGGNLQVAGGNIEVFSGTVEVQNDAYNVTTWNGNQEVPTKDAIRDKIESLIINGSFTPAITTTGGGATYTYGIQNGNYSVNGKAVTIGLALASITTIGTPSGTIRITGLPVSHLPNRTSMLNVRISQAGDNFYSVYGLVSSGQNYIELDTQTGLNGSNSGNLIRTIDPLGAIYISGTYLKA